MGFLIYLRQTAGGKGLGKRSGDSEPKAINMQGVEGDEKGEGSTNTQGGTLPG
jgi:hypothetical protein